MPTKTQIISVLKKTSDPELNVSIYDLGLIYNVTVGKKGDVNILMSLTSIGCPLFSTIQSDMETRIKKVKGVKSVSIELTFDPPWNMDKMSKEAEAAFLKLLEEPGSGVLFILVSDSKDSLSVYTFIFQSCKAVLKGTLQSSLLPLYLPSLLHAEVFFRSV